MPKLTKKARRRVLEEAPTLKQKSADPAMSSKRKSDLPVVRRTMKGARASSRRNAPAPNRNVVALAYDGLPMFEFSIAIEAFGLSRPEMGPDWYRFAAASIDPPPLRATGGVRLHVDGGLELLDGAGTVVLAGWKGIDVAPQEALLAALRAAHARGARLVSICSGVFALAAAGLLDGKRATTHWRYADKFAAYYPKIAVERDVLYVDEGEILTSAGSAAGIDLCLHIIRRDFGAKAANMVARRMVVPPHREGGQAQYVEQPVPRFDEAARLSPLLESVSKRLADRHSVADLARAAGMSERTFTRRFLATTGHSPGQWILEARLRRAQELLETTEAPVSAVAESCGFSDTGALRRHFLARLGVTPAAYRARFGDQASRRPAE